MKLNDTSKHIEKIELYTFTEYIAQHLCIVRLVKVGKQLFVVSSTKSSKVVSVRRHRREMTSRIINANHVEELFSYYK